MAVEVRQPSQRLEHKQTRRREGDAHRSSPTRQRSENAHNGPADQAKPDVVGTAGKGESQVAQEAVPCETKDVDVRHVERAEREHGHEKSRSGTPPDTPLPQSGTGTERDQQPGRAEIADRRPDAALASVDHRHRGTKTESTRENEAEGGTPSAKHEPRIPTLER